MDCPAITRISDYAAFHAESTPSAEAMVLGQERTTYRQLSDRVDACAKALLAAGVRKGDRVATLSTPHPEFLVTFLAASSIGAIWLGLNPRHTLDEYRYVIGDAEPKLVFSRTQIAGRDFRNDLLTLKSEFSGLNEIIVIGGDPPFEGARGLEEFIGAGDIEPQSALNEARAAVEPSDPALIVYTSGSTGKPKGALLPHRGLVHCSRVQARYWHPQPLRILNFFPINHIGSVGDLCAYTLVAGGTVVFLEQFDAEEQLKLLQEERITLWGGVPTTLQLSLDHPTFGQYDLSAIQLIAWSGAAAPRALAARLLALCPKLSNAYGMTETVGSVTFVAPSADLDLLVGTVGKPVPEYEVSVRHPHGAPVAAGETGEICVRGDFIMRGYWRRPEATAEAIDHDGWLHTGDLALLQPDGNLTLVGRLKEMFKSGGYNIYPLEIERIIEDHDDVAMAAVVAAPDPVFGEIGHAYVVDKPGSAVSEASLRALCRDRLANYKIPKRFTVLADMPMLPIGKIDKQELRRRASAQLEAAPQGAD